MSFLKKVMIRLELRGPSQRLPGFMRKVVITKKLLNWEGKGLTWQ